jgi:hypothetical protein
MQSVERLKASILIIFEAPADNCFYYLNEKSNFLLLSLPSLRFGLRADMIYVLFYLFIILLTEARQARVIFFPQKKIMLLAYPILLHPTDDIECIFISHNFGFYMISTRPVSHAYQYTRSQIIIFSAQLTMYTRRR